MWKRPDITCRSTDLINCPDFYAFSAPYNSLANDEDHEPRPRVTRVTNHDGKTAVRTGEHLVKLPPDICPSVKSRRSFSDSPIRCDEVGCSLPREKRKKGEPRWPHTRNKQARPACKYQERRIDRQRGLVVSFLKPWSSKETCTRTRSAVSECVFECVCVCVCVCFWFLFLFVWLPACLSAYYLSEFFSRKFLWMFQA